MKFDTVTKFREQRQKFIAAMNQLTADLKAGLFTPEEAKQVLAKMPSWQNAGKRFDQVEGMIRAVEKVTGNLGALPAIPAAVVAAVAGATYLLGKTLDEISTFMQRRSYMRQRIAEGASASDAMAEYSRANPKARGLFGDAAALVWPLAIVAGLFLLANRPRA